MASDDFARLLDQVGRSIIGWNPLPGADILLYAILDTMMVGDVLLVNREADVLAIFSDDIDFTYLMLDLWEEQPIGKRWAEMEYLVRNGRVTTIFTYPKEIDPEENEFDRRERIIRKHFGDKPLVYAPDEAIDRVNARDAEQQ